jgi:hypothetical protein
VEYIKEININEAVIHILDNNADGPILNEYALDLNEEIYNFCLKHIRKSFNDEELRYAFFNKNEDSYIKKISQQYLNGENNIIEISKEFANQMFRLMRSKGTIQSCDLLTVSFSTEYGTFLGIFKMDYIKNYMHNILYVEDKIGIDIIPQHTGLPTTKTKVQKCAFIKVIKQDNEYDVMLIDKENKRTSEDYGTNWFRDSYLGCKLIENERDQTKNFLNAAEKWTQYALPENAYMQEKVRTHVKKALLEEDNINIVNLAKDIFQSKEVQESFITDITMKCNDKITVDKDYVDKKLKRTRLKIDRDIDLYLSQEAYKDKNRLEITSNGDGSINITIKNVMNYIEK